MWYEHIPKSVVHNVRVKILWNVCIQCDHVIEARRPDFVIISNEDKNCFVVDVAIPGDSRLSEKEDERLNNTKI